MSIFNKPEDDFDKIRKAYNDAITNKFFDIYRHDKYHDDELQIFGCGIKEGNVVVCGDTDTYSKKVKIGVVKEVIPWGNKYKVRVQIGPSGEKWRSEETMLISSVLKIADSVLDYVERMGIKIEP